MTVRLTFDRPEFADGRVSVWSVGKHSAQPATVRLDERGQGYVPVVPGAAHDVVLRSNERPPEAARVQMPDTEADFDDVRIRPDGSLGQLRSDDDALPPVGILVEIRDELRLTRKTIAAHGLATAPHRSEGTIAMAVKHLAAMARND